MERVKQIFSPLKDGKVRILFKENGICSGIEMDEKALEIVFDLAGVRLHEECNKYFGRKKKDNGKCKTSKKNSVRENKQANTHNKKVCTMSSKQDSKGNR